MESHDFFVLVCYKMEGKVRMHIESAFHSGNQLRSEMHRQRAAYLKTQEDSLKYGAASDNEESDSERPKKRKRLVKSQIQSDIESDIESADDYESDGEACQACGKTDSTDENAILFCDFCNSTYHQQCADLDPGKEALPEEWFCKTCCKPRKLRIKLKNHKEQMESLQGLREIFERVKFKPTSEKEQLRFKFEHGGMVAKEPIFDFRKGRHDKQGWLAATLLGGMDASFTASIKKHIPLLEHIAGKLIRRSQRFAKQQNFSKLNLELLKKWDIQLAIIVPLADHDLEEHTDLYGSPFYWTVSMGPKGTTKFKKGTEKSGPHEEKDAVYAWNGSHVHWGIGKKHEADVRMFLVVKPTRIKDPNKGQKAFMSWQYDAEREKFTTPNISLHERPRGIQFKKPSN